MTVIVSSTVQAFFAWRVKKLTGKKWLCIVLNISSLIQFREFSVLDITRPIWNALLNYADIHSVAGRKTSTRDVILAQVSMSILIHRSRHYHCLRYGQGFCAFPKLFAYRKSFHNQKLSLACRQYVLLLLC